MGLVRKAGADDVVPGEGGSNMSTILRDAVAAEIERQRLERERVERQRAEHDEQQETDPA